MSVRELVVLGTASQVPTRHRNHNGYLLRWDGEGILFDPGEGTQRQMLRAGVAAHDIDRICVTHFHGDHSLGLAGVIQRINLDQVPHPVTAHYPASGQHFFERLRYATAYRESVEREVYAAAEALGLRKVAHAGEEGPPAYITEALDVLGVERIDHGLRCMEDPDLVKRLVADRVPLTLCPLSNVRLRAIDTLEEHPLRAMMDAGLLCTVNSDDPAYFGGYVGDTFHAVHEALGLEREQLRTLARNSFEAAFLDHDEERRARYLSEVEAYAFD